MRKKFDVLKRPGNPFSGNLVGPQIGDVLSFEQDLSGSGLINSTDAIEDSGLPRSVRPDDGINRPLLHFKANVRQRFDAAKRDSEILDFEDRVHIYLKKSDRVREALASRFKGDQSRSLPFLFTLCAMPCALCDLLMNYFVICIQSVSFSIVPSGFTLP